MIRFYLAFLMLATLTFTLSACQDGSHSDIDQHIKRETQKAQQINIAKPPEFINYQSIKFTNAKKDPFAIEYILNQKANKPKNPKLLTPLERYPLEELRLVGVINQGEKKWALVEIKSSKMVYPVSIGDPIGNRYGKIDNITEKKISVIEKTKKISGSWQEEKAELKL